MTAFALPSMSLIFLRYWYSNILSLPLLPLEDPHPEPDYDRLGCLCEALVHENLCGENKINLCLGLLIRLSDYIYIYTYSDKDNYLGQIEATTDFRICN